MGQRLVRAKTKIRDAKIPLEIPEREELPERLESVLEAIYAVYGQAWNDITSADSGRHGLAEEALWLARLMVRLLPEEPEPKGLLALVLYCHARHTTRRSPAGEFIPLSEQDTTLWSGSHIAEAETLLLQASSVGKMGRFQLEAAIQSAHMVGRSAEHSHAESIVRLYDALLQVAPTLGAVVGRTAALAAWQGAVVGIQTLDTLDPALMKIYQPYWALRAYLLKECRRDEEARIAYDRAIGLTEDDSVRRFLLTQRPETTY
jgi:RNA polymerase sigma-70 factor (ECF subfamily)